MQRLLTIAEAAGLLGVPKDSLRSAAKQHRLLVRMGRAIRIDPNDIPELIRKCQETPKVHASTDDRVMAASISEKAPDSCQRALETAAKLKASSPATSRHAIDQPKGRVIRLN